ncbi:MAG: M28 family peptidase, partial [Nitrospirales bacterium]
MDTHLQTHLEALVGERHPETAPTKLRHVEAYLAEAMRRLGLAVSVQTFEALGGLYRNVIGTIRPVGLVQEVILPEPAPLVVAAHYDSVSGSPGADDNASGLAVLLEAARLLRIAAVPREIRFVGFCLEEEDLLGSLAYASALRAQGQT